MTTAQVVLITGAASGIGLATAELLRAQVTMLVLLRRLLPQRGFELLVRRMFGMEGRSLSHRT